MLTFAIIIDIFLFLLAAILLKYIQGQKKGDLGFLLFIVSLYFCMGFPLFSSTGEHQILRFVIPGSVFFIPSVVIWVKYLHALRKKLGEEIPNKYIFLTVMFQLSSFLFVISTLAIVQLLK